MAHHARRTFTAIKTGGRCLPLSHGVAHQGCAVSSSLASACSTSVEAADEGAITAGAGTGAEDALTSVEMAADGAGVALTSAVAEAAEAAGAVHWQSTALAC